MQTQLVNTSPRRQMIFRDGQISPPIYTTPWDQYSAVAALNPGTTMQLYDDFQKLDTVASTGFWKATKGTGGTLALANQACGIINIPGAASTDNDYQLLSTQEPIFEFANFYPIAFEFYSNVTEAATNASSWVVGLSSVLTTGFLSNAGAPPASFSGVVFWKATGTLALNVMTSNGGTQNQTSSPAVTVVSGQSYILGAYLDPNDGTTGIVTWYISTVVAGVRSLLATGTLNLTLASLANMYPIMAIRNGSAGTAETLTVDYVEAYQTRVLF